MYEICRYVLTYGPFFYMPFLYLYMLCFWLFVLSLFFSFLKQGEIVFEITLTNLTSVKILKQSVWVNPCLTSPSLKIIKLS